MNQKTVLPLRIVREKLTRHFIFIFPVRVHVFVVRLSSELSQFLGLIQTQNKVAIAFVFIIIMPTCIYQPAIEPRS